MLRRRPLAEADRILTLFSRERGKLSAVAKGVRRTTSRFGARLDFMARVALTLHAGRSLDVVTSATLIEDAWSHLVEPDVFALASYVAETVDGLCEPDLPVPELYETLTQLQGLIARLDGRAARDRRALAAVRAVFDLQALAALGFAPELDGCARCGTPLGRRPFAGGSAALSPEAGGLVCRACLELGSTDEGHARRDFGIVRMRAADFALLRGARGLTLAEAHARPELAAIAPAAHAFVQQHLGRSSRSLASTSGRT